MWKRSLKTRGSGIEVGNQPEKMLRHKLDELGKVQSGIISISEGRRRTSGGEAEERNKGKVWGGAEGENS